MAADNNNKSMRVLVLATSYPLGPQDSSSVFLRYLAEHLHRQGIEVHVLAPADTAGGHSVENGIHVYRFRYMFKPLQKLCYGSGILPNLKRNPLLWAVVPFFLTNFLLATLLTTLRVKPDLVHGHWVVPTGVIGLFASKLFERPFIVTAHGGDAFSVRSGFMQCIKQYVIRHAQAWTANTTTTASAVDSTGTTGNLQIIPMGVDTELFAPGSRIDTGAGTVRRILFIGRLVEKKGVNVLLQALARLPGEVRQTLQLDIVGDGSEKAALQQQARDLAIDSYVNFEGRVSNEELPSYLQRADIFVGPSIVDSAGDTEGMGVVFLEAMACGVPVIASEIGGIGEVVEHDKTGLLVPSGDADKLSAALEELLGDGERRKRLARAAREKVAGTYGWQKIAERFISLYRQSDA